MIKKIKLFAHKGVCTKCGGMVKMSYGIDYNMNPPGHIRPDLCWCIKCAARYEADLEGLSVPEYDRLQWRQKYEQEKGDKAE